MGDAADDAYDAAMWEDDEPAFCGTCPDGVPAILPPEGWTCPECDAEWGDDDDATTERTSALSGYEGEAEVHHETGVKP